MTDHLSTSGCTVSSCSSSHTKSTAAYTPEVASRIVDNDWGRSVAHIRKSMEDNAMLESLFKLLSFLQQSIHFALTHT